MTCRRCFMMKAPLLFFVFLGPFWWDFPNSAELHNSGTHTVLSLDETNQKRTPKTLSSDQTLKYFW